MNKPLGDVLRENMRKAIKKHNEQEMFDALVKEQLFDITYNPDWIFYPSIELSWE
jgi:hypothetical protein